MGADLNSHKSKLLAIISDTHIHFSVGVLKEFATLSRSDLEERHKTQTQEVFDLKLEVGELKTRCEVAEDRERQARAATGKQREGLEKIADEKTALEQKISSIRCVKLETFAVSFAL